MINQIITNIKQDLSQILTPAQMEALSQTLNKHLTMLAGDKTVVEDAKHDMLPLFIAAKRVEGCSEKSLRYYESTIRNMLEDINNQNARSARKIYEAISIHTSVEELSVRSLWIT